MYCFADFEFTCGREIPKNDVEVLSVGLIVTDEKYNIKEEFYRTMKPIKHSTLTSFCTELTHLKQEEINSSLDSNKVFKEVLNLLEKYSVENIFVWGDYDKIAVYSDVKMHKNSSAPFNNILEVQKKIKNIQEDIAVDLGMNGIFSIKTAKEVFDIKNSGTLHNALTDAEIFLETCKITDLDDVNKYPEFIKFRKERKEKQIQQLKQNNINKKKREIPLTRKEKNRFKKLKKMDVNIANIYNDVVKMLPSNDSISSNSHTDFSIIAPFDDLECIQIIDKKKNAKNKFGIDYDKLDKSKYCVLDFKKYNYPIAKYNFAIMYANKHMEDKMIDFNYLDTIKSKNYFNTVSKSYNNEFKNDFDVVSSQIKEIFKKNEVRNFSGIQLIYSKNKKILITSASKNKDTVKSIQKRSITLPLDESNLDDVIIDCIKFLEKRKGYEKECV